MLILSRKAQEAIKIGNNIRIIVLSIHGKYVRIGIEADKELLILRAELKDHEKKGNRKIIYMLDKKDE